MKLGTFCVIAGLLIASASAQAATSLKFTFSGDVDVSFILPAQPTPTTSFPNLFIIDNVQVSFGGQQATLGLLMRDQTDSFFKGGFQLFDAAIPRIEFLGNGETLWTGTTAAPAIRTGTFALTRNDLFQDRVVPGTGTLTIEALPEVVAAVPEPATWAMLLTGLGMTGAALRRSRRSPA